MALTDDFTMYYGGTYVGYQKSNGEIYPFYIDNVTHSNSVLNIREMSSSEYRSVEYSKQMEDALTFNGHYLDGNGSYPLSLNKNDDNLLLDLPDSKYILVRGKPIWITYRSIRSTKKGLNSRKICGLQSITNSAVIKIFSSEIIENILMGCYYKCDNGDLLYKGVKVGKHQDNSFSLYTEASHHKFILEKGVENCQITLVDM